MESSTAVPMMGDVPDIRKKVNARLKELGWTAYRLAQEVKDHMSAPTVYNWLAGRSEIKSGQLEHILDAVRLDVGPRAAPAKRRPPAKRP